MHKDYATYLEKLVDFDKFAMLKPCSWQLREVYLIIPGRFFPRAHAEFLFM